MSEQARFIIERDASEPEQVVFWWHYYDAKGIGHSRHQGPFTEWKEAEASISDFREEMMYAEIRDYEKKS